MRRLPVYLLLDTSGSMYGEPIEAVKKGVSELIETLRQDPYALETVFLSVITFANEARQITPLTEVTAFTAPDLEARGQTSLGAALEMLAERLDTEVIKNTPEQKGDWKPLVFIMSDGAPTDQLDRGIEALQARKPGMIVACAAGKKASPEELKRITDIVVQLDNLDEESIKAFFKWVSASVSAGSAKVDTKTDGATLDELPPPPEEVIFV